MASHHRRRPRYCIVCGAVIDHRQPAGFEYCSCHHVPPRNPRCDPQFDQLVLSYLARAWPRPVNLYPLLGLDSRVQAHRDALHDSIDRWRERGLVITGISHIGYRLTARKVD